MEIILLIGLSAQIKVKIVNKILMYNTCGVKHIERCILIWKQLVE